MNKIIDKNSQEWQMFRDFYKIYQEYAIPEQTDEYWKKVINVCADFGEKYADASQELSKSMAIALLENLYKRGKAK